MTGLGPYITFHSRLCAAQRRSSWTLLVIGFVSLGFMAYRKRDSLMKAVAWIDNNCVNMSRLFGRPFFVLAISHIGPERT